MSKHTPGPWIVIDGNFVYAEDKTKPVKGVNGARFANRFSARIEGIRTPNEEIAANARLIAAAPDLLAALEGILEHVEGMDLERHGGAQCTLCHAYRMIGHSAIAKAKGATS